MKDTIGLPMEFQFLNNLTSFSVMLIIFEAAVAFAGLKLKLHRLKPDDIFRLRSLC